MVHAEDFAFDGDEVLRALGGELVNLREMLRRRPGHHDLPHVMHEARDVIRLIRRRLHRADDLAGEDGGADAMLPELAPREGTLTGEALEIFDDGRDHRELADLAHAQVENRLFDAVDRGGEAVIDGIDQAQEPGGQAGVAADDLGNLCRVALFGHEQTLQRLVDAAQRRQVGTSCQPRGDFLAAQPARTVGREHFNHSSA